MLAKTLKIACLLGAGLLIFVSLAAAKNKTINLGKDVVLPDGQTLKAGQYQVVVDQKVDQVQFIQHGTVVLKHRCKCVVPEKANEADGVVIAEHAGKKPLLQEIRFKGETRIITLPS